MVVADECTLDLSFRNAQARLTRLAYGSLVSVSQGAWGDGLAGLIRVGPLGAMPGLSKLVDVHILDLMTRDDSTMITLRWEATGPECGLFPALDAKITLTPDGENATTLALTGTYRPPLAALGAGLDKVILHRIAEATIRSFLNRIADALGCSQAAPDSVRAAAQPQPARSQAANDPVGGPPDGRTPRAR
jgi:hypothetical protein